MFRRWLILAMESVINLTVCILAAAISILAPAVILILGIPWSIYKAHQTAFPKYEPPSPGFPNVSEDARAQFHGDQYAEGFLHQAKAAQLESLLARIRLKDPCLKDIQALDSAMDILEGKHGAKGS